MTKTRDMSKKEWNKYHREKRQIRIAQELEENKNKEREIGYPNGISYEKPFYEVTEGYGYQGVILCDQKTGEVQCHICGGWFHWLQNHIIGAHKIKGDEYREKFKLNYSTALCSEKVRDLLVKRAMTYPWERLMKQKTMLIEYAKSGRSHNKKYREHNASKALESKNKLGTCALQILDQMVRKSKELGRQPLAKEMIGDRGTNLRQSIRHRFGSVAEMRKLLEIQGYLYKEQRKVRYTDKDLLEGLQKFAKIYKRKPSYSDGRRGLLTADISTYEKRFGGWNKAKALAFGQ